MWSAVWKAAAVVVMMMVMAMVLHLYGSAREASMVAWKTKAVCHDRCSGVPFDAGLR